MLKDIIDSIKSISAYERFKQKKLARVIIYLLVISLAAGFIITAAFQSRYREILTLVPKSYDSKFPNFTIENGILSTENNEPVVIEEGKVAIIFDTSASADENSLGQYKKGVLFLRDKVLIKTSRWGKLERSWNSLYIDYLDKEKGRELLGTIPGMIIGFNILVIFGLIFINIFSSLFIAFVFYLIKRFWKKKLTFSEVYKMTVHALTLPMVLLALGSIVLGERLSVSNYTYVFYIAGAYLILAIGRTDLPKKVTGTAGKNVDKGAKRRKKK
jgi:hypothetical protein